MSGIVRLRARLVTDPDNPRRQIASWEEPSRLPLEGWVDTQVSADPSDTTRKQTVARADLYCTHPNADVCRGDRVEYGGEMWVVEGFPDSPVNPFTGWRPHRVVSLKLAVG